jgi:hypothetical protein
MDLTWTCHVCGDDRPDRLIGVHKHRLRHVQSRVVMDENVRYCLDRPACAAAAQTFHFIDLTTWEVLT